MLPAKFRFIWPSGFREEDFFKSTNQKKELPVVSMFVNGSERNVKSLERALHRFFLPRCDSFGKAISEEIFKNRPIKIKNCLWRSCLLTDRDKMSNLHR
jgi:hypothetical protein